MSEADDKVGNPDPSILTSESMYRIDKSLRELVFRENLSLKELLTTDLTALKKAIDLAHENITRFPTEIDKQVVRLKELHDEKFTSIALQFVERDRLQEEKFTSIQVQFKERDVRVEQTARDTKVAVDAALQAAEKARTSSNESFSLATAKAEESFTKQIDGLNELIKTSVGGLVGQINDLKDRLTRVESVAAGKDEGRIAQQDSTKYVIAIVMVILGLLAFVAGRGGLH